LGGEIREKNQGGGHFLILSGVTPFEQSVAMTSTLDSATTVLQALRGNRADRPAARTGDSAILRAALEDSLYSIVGPQHFFNPLVIRSQELRTEVTTLSANLHSFARVRGILMHHALRLLSVGYSFANPFEELVAAWRCDVGENELLAFIDHLDREDRAKFSTDIAAHTTALRHGLGVIGASWSLRSTVRVSNLLCSGAVALRDTIDLSIDTLGEGANSTVLLDLTTAPLDENSERTLRFHALNQTLRTGVTPLRSGVLSTATGEQLVHTVDTELLTRAVEDVLEAAEKKAGA
jgi:hypothetical protein